VLFLNCCYLYYYVSILINNKPLRWVGSKDVSTLPLVELPHAEYQRIITTPFVAADSVNLVDLRCSLRDSFGITANVDVLAANELRGGQIDFFEVRRSRKLMDLVMALDCKSRFSPPSAYRDFYDSDSTEYQLRIKLSVEGIRSNGHTCFGINGGVFTIDDPSDLRDFGYSARYLVRARELALESSHVVYVAGLNTPPSLVDREKLVASFALAVSAIESAKSLTSKHIRSLSSLFEHI
jgi:hypothetical protein